MAYAVWRFWRLFAGENVVLAGLFSQISLGAALVCEDFCGSELFHPLSLSLPRCLEDWDSRGEPASGSGLEDSRSALA